MFSILHNSESQGHMWQGLCKFYYHHCHPHSHLKARPLPHNPVHIQLQVSAHAGIITNKHRIWFKLHIPLKGDSSIV